MNAAVVVALGYQYPGPTSAEDLSAAVDTLAGGVVAQHMRRFAEEVAELDGGHWEELHTATIDLSPQFVPYIGHVVWGDSYRRGAFMANLKGAMDRAGVELGGELPDHIEPVLRYLAAEPDPLGELTEVLPSAVRTMKDTLTKASPRNPYVHLLAATVELAVDLRPLKVEAHR